jgi:hypothetical protein
MLNTVSYSIPKITDVRTAKAFFDDCKSARTVDLKVESVLRRNNYTVPLLDFQLAITQLDELGYPDIVRVFLEAAIARKSTIRLEAETQALRDLWNQASDELGIQ